MQAGLDAFYLSHRIYRRLDESTAGAQCKNDEANGYRNRIQHEDMICPHHGSINRFISDDVLAKDRRR